MNSNTNPARSALLPLELTDLCLHFFLEKAKRRKSPRVKKDIAYLRLVCKHFLERVSGGLFGHVKLCLVPEQPRAKAFLDIVRNRNNSILKHIDHVTLKFGSASSSSIPSSTVTGLVEILANAPFTTLTISGPERADMPIAYNALQPLRCAPKLEKLVVAGTRIPSFLVCGHIGSASLKSIEIQTPCLPFHKISSNDRAFGEGSMVLGSKFQPLTKLQHLSLIKPESFPGYFPLHDFGSAYYPSNGRIPASLPSLRRLRAGNHLTDTPDGLEVSDYNVLVTILSLAPKLEEFFIIDEFMFHNGSNTLVPLVQQLPTMTHLKRLTLYDIGIDRPHGDEALSALCNFISAIPTPLPALETLSLRIEWPNTNPDRTRLALYLNGCWKELGQVLLRPTLASLRRFVLRIDIETILEQPFPDSAPESKISVDMGRGELDILQEALAQGISDVLGESSNVRVEVGITFDGPFDPRDTL